MTNWQLKSYGGHSVIMEAAERESALLFDVLPAMLAKKIVEDLVTPVPTHAASERYISCAEMFKLLNM